MLAIRQIQGKARDSDVYDQITNQPYFKWNISSRWEGAVVCYTCERGVDASVWWCAAPMWLLSNVFEVLDCFQSYKVHLQRFHISSVRRGLSHIIRQPKGSQKLTSVYEGVFLHVRLLVEPFATVLAGVGPGVWMYEQMSGEGGGALEHFSTNCTAERPVLRQKAVLLWLETFPAYVSF